MDTYEEQELRTVLRGEVAMSEAAERSLRLAYESIRASSRKPAARRVSRARPFGLRAALAACVVAACTTGVVYAASQSDLVGSVFGTQGRQSATPELMTHEFSPEEKAVGKEDFAFMMPGREYIDPTEAQSAIVQPYVREVGETVMVGDCAVTVLSAVNDGQRGAVTFKVENPNGLPAIDADSPGAVIKGVKVTDEMPLYWHISDGTEEGSVAAKLAMDGDLTTETCWQLTESYVVTDGSLLSSPVLEVFAFEEENNDEGLPLCTLVASVDISSEALPLALMDGSPVSMSASALGMSVEGISVDDCASLELVNSDGSSYLVFDDGEEPMDNTNCLCGFDEARRGPGFNLVFNRIVDWSDVVAVKVNGELHSV